MTQPPEPPTQADPRWQAWLALVRSKRNETRTDTELWRRWLMLQRLKAEAEAALARPAPSRADAAHAASALARSIARVKRALTDTPAEAVALAQARRAFDDAHTYVTALGQALGLDEQLNPQEKEPT